MDKKSINSEDIGAFFGLGSNIYSESMKYLGKEATIREIEHERCFKKWKTMFKSIYHEAIDSNLFLRHTYYTLILKSLVVIKLGTIQGITLEDMFKSLKSKDLESLKLFEFDYFYWVDLNKKIFSTIYNAINGLTFARQDLFLKLYQQIFIVITRHKIGEFYTPSRVVKTMIDDFYDFGVKVLDPSCGSGSFLINIMISIINSDKTKSLKFEALENVYGFDINPLAIFTTKINIFLLFLENYNHGKEKIPNINIFLFNSLFPLEHENETIKNTTDLFKKFDLVIGNPPWLTYKDLQDKESQKKIRDLSEMLEIKPLSQYITHIELAAVFFYAIPHYYLKIGGKIFFVITKSVLNGDHCYKFRSFKLFEDLEIWDFPTNYFFNVNHICLKGTYIGANKKTLTEEKYPIRTKIFNDKLELLHETLYSSLKIETNGARLILPVEELKKLENISSSLYKGKFFQGATLVPRTLIFFHIEKKEHNVLTISSDSDIITRSKKNWKYTFQNKKIEPQFMFRTFLNRELVPFHLKAEKTLFLPVTNQLQFSMEYLQKFPLALKFYEEMNAIYKKRKKSTSDINSLFSNLNYWNKLSRQSNIKEFVVVYNASGSNLKAAVLNVRKHRIIIGSENYYYSTDSENEASYLSAILNSPNLLKFIKIIKSSRHIHKRPFSFPIPIYNEQDANHKLLAHKGIKCKVTVQDLVNNNPKINSEKVRTIINKKLVKILKLTEQVVFK